MKARSTLYLLILALWLPLALVSPSSAAESDSLALGPSIRADRVEHPPSGTQTLERRGKIARVTLYRAQAKVTRSLSVDAPVGEVVLVVTPLPYRVRPDSLRIDASDGLVVRTVFHRVHDPDPAQVPQILELDAHQAQLEAELTHLLESQETLAAQQRHLDELDKLTARELPSAARISAQDMQSLVLFSFEQRQMLALARHENREEMRRKEEEMAELARARAKQVAALAPLHQAVVALTKTKPGATTLELSYRVDGVGWEPTYRLAANSQTQQVHFEHRALVVQQSGEDWNGVVLEMDADLAAPPPAPKPLGEMRLELGKHLKSVEPPTLARQLREITDHAIPSKFARSTGPEFEQTLSSAKVWHQSQPQQVALGAYELEAQWSYLTIPLQSSKVFREAKLRNPAPHALLSGRARVYFDGNFAGEITLPHLHPEETFDVAMGVAPKLYVTRELVSRHAKEVANKRVSRLRYRLTLHNPQGMPGTVRILDRLPVTQARGSLSIVPRELSHTLSEEPHYVAHLKPMGILRWDVELEPNQTRWSVSYEYQIKHERGFHLRVTESSALPHPAQPPPPGTSSRGSGTPVTSPLDSMGWQLLEP